MLLIFINTFCDSLSDIIYKKAITMGNIKPTVFQYFGELISIPAIFIMAFITHFGIAEFGRWGVILAMTGTSIIFIIRNNIEQGLYREEKISTLLPYMKIHNFLTIIAGFFMFHDASWISFGICLFSLILATVASIDFKNHTFPKNFKNLMAHEGMRTVELLVSLSLLKILSTTEYAIISQTIYIIIAGIVIVATHELSEFKKFTPKITMYRWGGYAIGIVAWFIDLFLMQEFGIVIATLMGFFGSSLSLIFAYVFLREIPGRKDILLGLSMIILGGLGYYFR